MNNKIASCLTIAFIALVYLLSLIYYQDWKNGAITAGGDQFGYYVYEPSAFIYHDLGTFNNTIEALKHHGGADIGRTDCF